MNFSDELKPALPWLKVLFWLVTAAIGVMALRLLAPIIFWVLNVIAPFALALIVAYVFHPIVTFVQRKLKLGRIAGILILFVGILLALGGVLTLLAPVLYEQMQLAYHALRENLPIIFDELTARYIDADTRAAIVAWFDTNLAQLDQQVSEVLSHLGGAAGTVAEGSFSVLRQFVQVIYNIVAGIGGFVVLLIFVVIIAFYYLVDMDQIPGVIHTMLPEKNRERWWRILKEGDRSVGGFLRGQLIVCLCVGTLTTVLLFAIGMRQYAVLVGFFAGLINFIPYLGPVTGFLPAMLWILFTGDLETWGDRGVRGAILLGGFAIIQMIEGFVLQPFVVGRGASLHPLAVMFALAVGAQAGIGGMIIAVPVACFVKVLWVELYWRKRKAGDPDHAPGPSPLAE